MAKKPTTKEPSPALAAEATSLTVMPVNAVQAYKDSSSLIVRAYDQAQRSGVEFIKARICLGYLLAKIRQEKGHGALSQFYKLAAKGTQGLGKPMSKPTLQRSLQFWDQFAQDNGIGKKEVLAIEEKHHLGDAQLELWTAEPPKDGDEMLKAVHAWALKKGLAAADHEMLAKPALPPAGGGSEPEETDPVEAARQKAVKTMENISLWLKTDPNWLDDADQKIERTAEELAEHTPTWSALDMNGLTELMALKRKGLKALETFIAVKAGKKKPQK